MIVPLAELRQAIIPEEKFKYNKDHVASSGDICGGVLKAFTRGLLFNALAVRCCKSRDCEKAKLVSDDFLKERRYFWLVKYNWKLRTEYLDEQIVSFYKVTDGSFVYKANGRIVCQRGYALVLGVSRATVQKAVKTCVDNRGFIPKKVSPDRFFGGNFLFFWLG